MMFFQFREPLEAIQFTGKNFDEVSKFSDGQVTYTKPWEKDCKWIRTRGPGGEIEASAGCWVTKDPLGGFGFITADIMESVYTQVKAE